MAGYNVYPDPKHAWRILREYYRRYSVWGLGEPTQGKSSWSVTTSHANLPDKQIQF